MKTAYDPSAPRPGRAAWANPEPKPKAAKPTTVPDRLIVVDDTPSGTHYYVLGRLVAVVVPPGPMQFDNEWTARDCEGRAYATFGYWPALQRGRAYAIGWADRHRADWDFPAVTR